MDDKYIINISMPIKNDLISEIKNLKKQENPNLINSEKEATFLLSNVSKTKKHDKKEKAEKKKNKNILDNNFLIRSSDKEENENKIEQYDFGANEMDLLDIDEIFREKEDDDDNIDETIIDEQRKGYDKLKKEENPFKKEFAEELTLLYNLLDEVNKFSKKLDKKFDMIESSKTRGMNKYINDLILSILNSKQNRLNILKEITSLKKTIADLKIKSDDKNKVNLQTNNTSEHLASAYLNNIIKYGRNNFVKAINNNDDEDGEIDDMISKIEESRSGLLSDELENYQKKIEDRLDSEDNPFRSDDGNKYIAYENRGVKISIKKCVDTGEWEFIALDKYSQQITDYPMPNKKDVGKVKFSSDGSVATDERGRSYKVVEYYSPMD